MKKKIINKNNFEQSIEFIYPNKETKNPLPLILYIGGTGWLGYFPIIYRVADIWNKRIIYKLVNEGYTCGIIRYRGKFFKPLSFRLNIILILIALNLNIYLCLISIIFIIYWTKSSKYFPTMVEMEDDLIKNINYCLLYNNNFIKSEMNTNGEIIFMAYSAGSHLLLSCFPKINININNVNLIKKIIIISGVLNIPKKVDLKNGLVNKMTNLVLDLIFNDKEGIPNFPDDKILLYDKIPFLIVRSKNEFLNLPLIENVAAKFFDYKNFINNIKILEMCEVNSNHWLILTNKAVLESIKNFINK